MSRHAAARRGLTRVAHVVLGLRLGGLEQIVVQLAGRVDRSRFDPVVLVLEEAAPLGAELQRAGVPVEVVGREPGGFDPSAVVRLSRALSAYRVDVVHTHNPAAHLYGALAAALTRGPLKVLPRVVHTKHGRNVPHTAVNVAISRIATALTDRVVAVGQDAFDVARDVDRAAPDRLELVLNGIDAAAFEPSPGAAARASLGLPASGPTVGCVARLSPEKGHIVLLEAFADVAKRLPDARLVLVGDGPSRADLEARARAPDLEGRVVFAGVRRDVATVLSAFDVFALASFTEGICLALLEAAAAGLPLVATSVGGNTEIVEHEVSGLVVPPRDPRALAAALERVLTSERRAQLGQAARAHVSRRFSAEAMVRSYERIYDEVCSGRRRGIGPRRERDRVSAGCADADNSSPAQTLRDRDVR